MTTPQPIRLISSMATRTLLARLISEFERGGGGGASRVALESAGGVEAAKRVQADEPFDVVVLASDAIDKLLAAGKIAPDGKIDLARSGVAAAVRAGATRPDIGSEPALRQAVLDAKRIGYSTGPSGVRLLELFRRWGIADALADRLVQAPPGVAVGSLVADGSVELGFQQLSELMDLPGIELLGPLPREVQITTTFSAGRATASTAPPEALRALLGFLVSRAADEAKLCCGMQPAARC